MGWQEARPSLWRSAICSMATVAGFGGPLWHLALIVTASVAGYLFWNWHPAKVFMGDAGSVPLGFLLGWLMLDLALRGYWVAALILPFYFAADATFTLLKRGLRGEKPWQAHREHFYQRAVLGGVTPPGVVWRVAAANVALIALALASITPPSAGSWRGDCDRGRSARPLAEPSERARVMSPGSCRTWTHRRPAATA